jgi:signal peptidase I
MGTEGENSPKAKAGWYPDPSQADTLRYWDGENWTEQRGPATPAADDLSAAEAGRRRFLFLGGALVVVAAIVVAVVLIAGGGSSGGDTTTYKVPSESMAPTFKIGDTLTVDLDAYAGSEPAVGDVVVFRPPSGAESSAECGVLVDGEQPVESGEPCPKPTSAESRQLFVKRIVAVGGDTLSIKEGQAMIDGERQDEKAFTAPCGAGYECNLPRTIKIPPGYFFVMGDNRGESDDSRYWGPVPAAWIVGRVEG